METGWVDSSGHRNKVTALALFGSKHRVLSAGDGGSLVAWDMAAKRSETPAWATADTCQICEAPFFWNFRAMWDRKVVGIRQVRRLLSVPRLPFYSPRSHPAAPLSDVRRGGVLVLQSGDAALASDGLRAARPRLLQVQGHRRRRGRRRSRLLLPSHQQQSQVSLRFSRLYWALRRKY